MRHGSFWMLALLSGTLLAGCAETQADMEKSGARQLTGAELRTLYAQERKFTYTTADGNGGTSVYSPDGAASVNWGSGSDTGKWRIEGDTVCVAWKVVRNGEERCVRLFRTGEGQYKAFGTDGSFRSQSRLM